MVSVLVRSFWVSEAGGAQCHSVAARFQAKVAERQAEAYQRHSLATRVESIRYLPLILSVPSLSPALLCFSLQLVSFRLRLLGLILSLTGPRLILTCFRLR